MNFRSEHEEWLAELAGEKPHRRGLIVLALVGIALAALLVAYERGLL